MKPNELSDVSFGDHLRRVARWGLAVGGAALLIGVGLSIAGQDHAGRVSLIAGLGTLVGLPIVNVVIAVAEELRRRDWFFLFIATAVLLVLLYNARHLSNIFAG